MLGYPDAALVDASRALEEAREIGQAATLMYALVHALLIHIQCGNYAAANAKADELVALANKKGALFWKAQGMSKQGCIMAVTGKATEAVQMITSGVADWRSTDQRYGCRCICLIWREHMLDSANSNTLGAALRKL